MNQDYHRVFINFQGHSLMEMSGDVYQVIPVRSLLARTLFAVPLPPISLSRLLIIAIVLMGRFYLPPKCPCVRARTVVMLM
jgi:hypothetical protein